MTRQMIDKMVADEIRRPGFTADPVRKLWYWFRSMDRDDLTDPVEVANDLIWPWWKMIPLAHPVFDTPAGKYQSAAHFRMKKHDVRRESLLTSPRVGQTKWECALEMYGQIRTLVSEIVGQAIRTGLRRDHMPRTRVTLPHGGASWKIEIDANLWG